MKFEIIRNDVTGDVTFSGSYSKSDFDRLTLHAFDRLVLRSECKTAADHLLCLETLYRRHEEQQEQQDER